MHAPFIQAPLRMSPRECGAPRMCVCVCVCVCVCLQSCACVRACVRVCMHACVSPCLVLVLQLMQEELAEVTTAPTKQDPHAYCVCHRPGQQLAHACFTQVCPRWLCCVLQDLAAANTSACLEYRVCL